MIFIFAFITSTIIIDLQTILPPWHTVFPHSNKPFLTNLAFPSISHNLTSGIFWYLFHIYTSSLYKFIVILTLSATCWVAKLSASFERIAETVLQEVILHAIYANIWLVVIRISALWNRDLLTNLSNLAIVLARRTEIRMSKLAYLFWSELES